MKFISTIIIIIFSILNGECSDLNQSECSEYPTYCEWNEENEECQEIGGGGGSGDIEYGPYQFSSISQSDGMRDGPHYADADLFYPIDALLPLKSIVLGPGWGDNGSSMSGWAELFASHGFIAATLDYNDADNDTHYQRGEAMLDLIITIKQENLRIISPVYNKVDTLKFAAGGYSISGGSAVNAGLLDTTQVLDAIIALNPTVIFEDCDLCAGYDYCICLVPEFLENQVVPTLIISGENEVLELPSYDGMLGINIYENHPEAMTKMIYEIQNGGHGSASLTNELVINKSLNWLKYHLMDSIEVCEQLIEVPNNTSVFSTTLVCNQGPDSPIKGYLRAAELSICQESCGDYYIESEEGQFLSNVVNQNSILNFEDFLNRFVQVEGESVQCVECDALNITSIILANDCANPVNCFINPCSNGECISTNNIVCVPSYCGDCYADYYDSNNDLIVCEPPLNMTDLSSIDFGDCESVLGFGWANNHCQMLSGCGSVIDGVDYSEYMYNTLSDCASASTLEVDENYPVSFNLNQNHPNPFNPSTTISYKIPFDDFINISIYDMTGKLIKTLFKGLRTEGSQSILWDATNNQGQPVSAGVYLYTIQAGEYRKTKKMILLK